MWEGEEKKGQITLFRNMAETRGTETDMTTAKNKAAKRYMAAELVELGLTPPAIARLLNLENEGE